MMRGAACAGTYLRRGPKRFRGSAMGSTGARLARVAARFSAARLSAAARAMSAGEAMTAMPRLGTAACAAFRSGFGSDLRGRKGRNSEQK